MKNAFAEFDHDVEPFISEYTRDIVEKKRPFNRRLEESLFRKTHDLVAAALGDEAWRHYRNGRHTGPLSVYVFETLTVGIALNIDKTEKLSSAKLRDKVVAFKQAKEFTSHTGAGANSKTHLLARLGSAKDYFAKERTSRNGRRTKRTSR